MTFFDYVFYRISKVYIVGIDDVHPEIYTAGIISLFQVFNLIAILYFLFLIKMPKYLVILIALLLYLLNLIFSFNKKKLLKCQEKWDNEPKKANRLRGVLVIVYFLASIFFYGLAMSKMY